MGAKLLYRFKEAYGQGVIEGVIWDVPVPVPPSEHRVKYRLVFIVNAHRLVGYDNERGKGDHKHIREEKSLIPSRMWQRWFGILCGMWRKYHERA